MTEATPSTAPATEAPEERGFTQEDIKKIAANEKREGKQAAINDLLQKSGAESLDDVIAAYTERQQAAEREKTVSDRAEEARKKAETQRDEADARYTNTLREYALRDSLRDAGINPERLKGAMRLADLSALEVDADGNVNGIEDVVGSVREEAPEFFAATERPRVNAPQTSGTGIARPNTDTYEGQMGGFLNNLLSAP